MDRADRLPRDPGARRRRTDGERPGRDRGRRATARKRPLHGTFRSACSVSRASRARCSAVSSRATLSWRWIFYVNLPVGIVAFFVLAATLPADEGRVDHVIDYLGTGAARRQVWRRSSSATSLGGNTYPWGSAFIIGLAVAGVIMIAALPVRGAARRRAGPATATAHQPGLRRWPARSASSSVSRCSARSPISPLFLQVVKGLEPDHPRACS